MAPKSANDNRKDAEIARLMRRIQELESTLRTIYEGAGRMVAPRGRRTADPDEALDRICNATRQDRQKAPRRR